MVTINVNVTKKDIGNGQCNSVTNCPIARAVLRLTKKGVGVSVGSDIELDKGDDNFFAIPSKKDDKLISDFIDNFDTLQEVKPFSFKLKVPNKAAGLFRKSAIVSA